MSQTCSTTEPVRTCVGCRSSRPQSALVRCALNSDGAPLISRTAPGRGAWLCVGKVACVQQAMKRRGFERAWKRPVASAEYEELRFAYEAMMANMNN